MCANIEAYTLNQLTSSAIMNNYIHSVLDDNIAMYIL